MWDLVFKISQGFRIYRLLEDEGRFRAGSLKPPHAKMDYPYKILNPIYIKPEP